MRIEILTTFIDGRDRFEKDDIRTVSDEDAARFIKNGWAKPAGSEAPAVASPAAVEVAIHSSRHATKGRTHG